MVNIDNIAQQRIPVPEEPTTQTEIKADVVLQFKETTTQIINTDSRIRLGMFNLEQQKVLLRPNTSENAMMLFALLLSQSP
jgi:hypothetical protein